MDLQGNEPHVLDPENDHQNSGSEGSSNYTLAPTSPVMPPPPNKTFATREELVSSAKLHAAAHGYALVIRTSRPGKLWLKCDRGERYRNWLVLEDDQRKRKTETRLIGCCMEVIGKEGNGLWKMYSKEATHNHEPFSDTSAPPSLRRFTNEQIQKVQTMTKAGQAPRSIWAVLKKQYSDLNIKMSDLYNLRGHFRTQGLGARTSIQAFLQVMQEGEIFHRYKLDEGGHVTHLFFAHPSSIELFRAHSDVLLLDCTYNFNRLKMPLLNMVGATGMNTTLQVALAYEPKLRQTINGL